MAEEHAEVEYLLDEDLGDNGGHLLVRTADQLEAWVQKEWEFWAWLNEEEVSTADNLQNVARHVMNILDQLRANADHVKSDANPAGHLGQIRSLLAQQYRTRTVLHSGTPEAGFIERLREEEGLVEAAAALGKYINQSLELDDFRQFRGALALVVFLEGATPKSTPAVRGSLKKLADEYRERYHDDVKAADALRDRLQGLVDDHTTLKERGIADMAQAVKLARKQAERQRAEAGERLTVFEAIYDAKLALDAPVKYWHRKCTKHRWLATAFFVAFIIYIPITFGYVAGLVRDTEVGTLQFWQTAEIGISALALVLVGITVALARILLRLGMSQLHLGNDADERVTMVNTYLALRRGQHTNEGHMQVVIERLFAPAADGIVKDDLGPVTGADAIRSAFTRK